MEKSREKFEGTIVYNESYKDIEAIEGYKLMKEMSGEVFHDFKNILATISGLAQLSMIKEESEEIKVYLEKINQVSMDFTTTLNRYYNLANENPDKEKEALSICKVLNSAIDMVSYRLHSFNRRGNDIELIVNIQSSAKVFGYSSKLEQCFLNLLSNAIDSMDQTGGTLIVKVYDDKSKDYVNVDIIDTGSGVSEENLQRLFKERFTTKSNGTGLGLNIAKNCVVRYGGSLEIASKLNKGTKIHISLPIYYEN